jgi:uroporphyrinogen-III synthase
MQVIVTRPRLEADSWVKQLRARHLDAVALPLIHIGAPADSTGVAQAWQNLHQYSAVMFVSSNAVRYFYQSNRHIASVLHADVATKNIANVPMIDHMQPRMWATGPGTREALLAQSVPADVIDAPALDAPQFDSEALWARVQSQVKPGDKVLIVRGCSAEGADHEGTPITPITPMNGRPWLADQLTAAGVQVDMVLSYLRSAPVFDAAEQALMVRACSDWSLWLLSSSEAVGHLSALLQALPEVSLVTARALATHPRIAQAARAAGFGVVYESRPLLADVVASIESLV